MTTLSMSGDAGAAVSSEPISIGVDTVAASTTCPEPLEEQTHIDRTTVMSKED
jgi:hypothetical protein